jgi:hypothetical protein
MEFSYITIQHPMSNRISHFTICDVTWKAAFASNRDFTPGGGPCLASKIFRVPAAGSAPQPSHAAASKAPVEQNHAQGQAGMPLVLLWQTYSARRCCGPPARPR